MTAGLVCMFGYVFLFVATNAVTKRLSESLPLTEIALFRYALAVPTILLVLGATRGATLRIDSAGLHLVRGVLAVIGSLSGYGAMASLPLGDATALFFLSPLLVTAGAALMLRERPSAVRGSCIVAGFIGVLMIAQPHFASLPGVMAGLANAACAASGVLLVRHARNRESALSLALTTSLVCSAVLSLPASAVWVQPSLPEFAALVALGVMGGFATALLNTAYQSAPAPLLASIDYLSVPGSLLAGALVWNDSPTAQAFAGAAIVVAAGLSSLACRSEAGADARRSGQRVSADRESRTVVPVALAVEIPFVNHARSDGGMVLAEEKGEPVGTGNEYVGRARIFGGSPAGAQM